MYSNQPHNQSPAASTLSPRARTSARFTAAIAAVVLPAASLAFGLDAASATQPDAPRLADSVSTVAVAQKFGVYQQTGKYFFQDGVVDPVRDLLYVADATDYEGINHLIRTDLRTGTSTAIPLGGGYAPSDVAVSPFDGTVYVSHSTAAVFPGDKPASISVLDPDATYTDTNLPPQIPTPTNHPQKLEVGADGRVYALHVDPQAVTVIGASNGPDRMNVLQSMTNVVTDAGVTAIDPDRNILYVASATQRTVTAISTASTPAVVLGTFSVTGEPIGLAYDSTRDQLVASFGDSNTIAWLAPSGDLSSAAVTRTESLAPLPADAEDYSLARSLMVTSDGTALALTEVFPTELKSFVSVVPATVSATTPVYSVPVGNDGISLVPDTRSGGTAYVLNAGNGTISAVTGVTLSTYAQNHYSGTAGVATATLVRADGRSIPNGTLDFSNPPAETVTAALDSSGTATATVSDLPIGSAAYTVSVSSPVGISLSGTSTIVTDQNTSTATLALNASSIVEGDALTATVTVALAAGTASGPISVTDESGTVYGTGTLDSGSATVAISGLPVGETDLVARFAGTDSVSGSVSAAVSVTVSARSLVVIPSITSGAPGAPITITLEGFAAGEDVEVTLHSDPILLGVATVDQAGNGSLRTAIPSVAPGLHHIVAVGLESGRTVEIPFQVLAAATTTTPTTTGTAGGLASTGFEATGMLAAAGALVLLGVSGWVYARRARRSTTS